MKFIKNSSAILCLFFVSFTFSFSCSDTNDSPEGLKKTPDGNGPQIIFDPLAKPVPEVPFPNNLLTRPDNTSTTKIRLNISEEAPTELERNIRKKMNSLNGFGTYSPITVAFSDPIDLSTANNDNLLLFNVDKSSANYGRRVLLDLGQGYFPITQEDTQLININGSRGTSSFFENDYFYYAPDIVFYDEDKNWNGILDSGEDLDEDGRLDRNYADINRDGVDDYVTFYEVETNTLIMRPVFPLDEETTYAVVITEGLLGENGESVRSAFKYINHLTQSTALEPLFEILPSHGLSVDDVAFTWTFTTQSITSDLTAISKGFRGDGPFSYLASSYPISFEYINEIQPQELGGVSEGEKTYILKAGEMDDLFRLLAFIFIYATSSDAMEKLFSELDFYIDKMDGYGECEVNTKFTLLDILFNSDCNTFRNSIADILKDLFGSEKNLVDNLLVWATDECQKEDSILYAPYLCNALTQIDFFVDSSYVDYYVFGTFRSPSFRQNPDIYFDMNPITGEAEFGEDEIVTFFISVPKAHDEFIPPFDVALNFPGTSSFRFESIFYSNFFARYGIASVAIDPVHVGAPAEIYNLTSALLGELDEEMEKTLTDPKIGGALGNLLLPYLIKYDPKIDSSEDAKELGIKTIVDVLDAFSNTPLFNIIKEGRAVDLTEDGIPDPWADFYSANAFRTRDILRQTVVDGSNLVRIIKSFNNSMLKKDGGYEDILHGDFNSDGQIDIGGSNSKFYIIGQSGGGLMGIIGGAVIPEIEATAFLDTGGGLSDIALRTDLSLVRTVVFAELLGPILYGIPKGHFDQVGIYWNYAFGDDEFSEYIGRLKISQGDLVVARNTVNNEVREIKAWSGGNFRVGVPTDKDNEIEIVVLSGQDGTERGRLTTLAPVQGFGFRRNSPDFRRFEVLAQGILDGGDPINYIIKYRTTNEPNDANCLSRDPYRLYNCYTQRSIEGFDERGILLIHVPGDMTVPINTGVALSRVAGMLSSLEHQLSIEYGFLEGIGDKIGYLTNEGNATSSDDEPCNSDKDDCFPAYDPLDYDFDDIENDNTKFYCSDGFIAVPPEPDIEMSSCVPDIDTYSMPGGLGPLTPVSSGKKLSSIRFPFVCPNEGCHVPIFPNPVRSWISEDGCDSEDSRNICNLRDDMNDDGYWDFDWGSYLMNMISVYFASDGTEIIDDLCMEEPTDIKKFPSPSEACKKWFE